jgi:heptosyltransferase-2
MVGDVVLGLPALKLLAEHGYELHLYGKGWSPGLLEAYGWDCTVRASSWRARIHQLRQLKQRCLAIDPSFNERVNTLVMPNSFSSAFEPWCAGLRVAGYPRDGRSLLLARKERPDGKPHSLDGFWQLACSFLGEQRLPPPCIGLDVTPDAQARADRLLANAGVAPGFICIVPYAAGVVDKQEKKWPLFPDLTQRLPTLGRQIVTCPGPGEEGIARQFHPAATLMANIDLAAYNGVLKRAALVISNDTGPAHMAAAVGAPVLSVLGPTKAEQWAPWGSQVRVVQAAGRQWPLVDDVLQQAKVMLA